MSTRLASQTSLGCPVQPGLTYGQEAGWGSLKGERRDTTEASHPCRKTVRSTGEARLEQERVGGGTKKWESGMGFCSEHAGGPFLRPWGWGGGVLHHPGDSGRRCSGGGAPSLGFCDFVACLLLNHGDPSWQSARAGQSPLRRSPSLPHQDPVQESPALPPLMAAVLVSAGALGEGSREKRGSCTGRRLAYWLPSQVRKGLQRQTPA